MSGLSLLSAIMYVTAIVLSVNFGLLPINTGSLIAICFFLAGVALSVMDRQKRKHALSDDHAE